MYMKDEKIKMSILVKSGQLNDCLLQSGRNFSNF